ncbi:FAD-binding protein [Actinomadura syzygii]|uniref:FAD-binding protein n=1 Tax=Actinomadura syzygii TaxID=1427538 RepID=UPI0036167284
MRIAVLAKQIPHPSEMRLENGQLVRDQVRLETNSYCRRANAQAVAMAGEQGEVVVFTMGPPSAEQTVREMVARGATRGVLISDPAFAGSDTLITARVLARAIEREGEFDLVLTGEYSLDSETGQVNAQLAELLGLPFIGPCKTLHVVDGVAVAMVELDGGYADVAVLLPAVASAAERLCAPSKASPDECAAVPAARIGHRTAADLGFQPGEVGLAASPTQVGTVLETAIGNGRAGARTASAEEALRLLDALPPAPGVDLSSSGGSAVPRAADGRDVWYLADPTSGPVDPDLLNAVRALARRAGRRVVGVVGDDVGAVAGAVDGVLRFCGANAPDDWVRPICAKIERARPHCVIFDATNWGRELAARIAARLGWGLVGDAVRFTVEDGAVVAWKAAFSGQAMVPISSSSPTLLATVRSGALAGSPPPGDVPGRAPIETVLVASVSKVIYSPTRDPDVDARELGCARCVVVVGRGVDPGEYGELDELRELLGAGPLAATRKVADSGWLPRTRQIGITGRSLAPELVVSIGANGGFNHSAGFVSAGRILAVNVDPDAKIFEVADVGIVGDWRRVVRELCAALRDREVTALPAPRG